MVVLNEVERRVLGVLIEKDFTTPEYYPLSLNATVNACNQKSSREPVMELSEADVRTALYELDNQGLVRTLADARVAKFEHRAYDALKLRRDEVAVLALLLLRGPQTSAELRTRAERMYGFEDNAAALATLERMSAREQPLTTLLPRQPGAREARWAQLLGGPVEAAAATHHAVAPRADVGGGREELAARVAELEARVLALETRLNAIVGSGASEDGGA